MATIGINTVTQDRVYTWADLQPKPQKYPNKITDLQRQINELDREYIMLTDVKPLPYGELVKVADKLEKLDDDLTRVWNWFMELPRTCEACGAPIVASGEVMRCFTCGITYHPNEADTETIPF